MFKDYKVKNTALNSVLTSKFITRVEADASIGIDRLVEKNASTGNIQASVVDSVRVIGANQDVARIDGDMFDAEIGLVNVVAGTDLVAGQLAKAGAGGKAIGFIDAGLKGTVIDSSLGTAFTNQPANDKVDVVSASALDITQEVTIHGTAVSTGAYLTETLTLTGDTAVTTTANFATVVGVEIDTACVGAVTVSENSGSLAIVEIAAGDLSAGVVYITDGFAYNKKAAVVASAASSATVLVAHKATDGGDEAILPATLNGTTAVELSAVSFEITKLMVGSVASDVTVSAKVSATEDDLKLAVGKVVKGADADGTAVVLI
jgi:hypothetical protein